MMIMDSCIVVLSWCVFISTLTLKKQQFTDFQVLKETYVFDARFASQWLAVLSTLISLHSAVSRAFHHE
mgnify:FL=1